MEFGLKLLNAEADWSPVQAYDDRDDTGRVETARFNRTAKRGQEQITQTA